jgi:hypothetical protein
MSDTDQKQTDIEPKTEPEPKSEPIITSPPRSIEEELKIIIDKLHVEVDKDINNLDFDEKIYKAVRQDLINKLAVNSKHLLVEAWHTGGKDEMAKLFKRPILLDIELEYYTKKLVFKRLMLYFIGYKLIDFFKPKEGNGKVNIQTLEDFMNKGWPETPSDSVQDWAMAKRYFIENMGKIPVKMPNKVFFGDSPITNIPPFEDNFKECDKWVLPAPVPSPPPAPPLRDPSAIQQMTPPLRLEFKASAIIPPPIQDAPPADISPKKEPRDPKLIFQEKEGMRQKILHVSEDSSGDEGAENF